MFKKSKEELRRVLELRRSNSATPIKNKKRYTRDKSWKGEVYESYGTADRSAER